MLPDPQPKGVVASQLFDLLRDLLLDGKEEVGLFSPLGLAMLFLVRCEARGDGTVDLGEVGTQPFVHWRS